MNDIFLTENRAIVHIPEDTIELKLICKIYLDGELREVEKTLSMKEVRKALDDADKNYIEDDDTFIATDKIKSNSLLTPAQRYVFDAWNAEHPDMRMTEREFLGWK